MLTLIERVLGRAGICFGPKGETNVIAWCSNILLFCLVCHEYLHALGIHERGYPLCLIRGHHVSLLRRYQIALLEATLLVKFGYFVGHKSEDCVLYILVVLDEGSPGSFRHPTIPLNILLSPSSH